MDNELSHTSPVLRPATPEESEFFYQVKKAALGPYVEAIWGWNEEEQRRFHEEEFNPSQTQVISLLGRDIGAFSVIDEKDQILLRQVFILPEFQNKGIGTGLICKVLKQASDRRIPVLLQVLVVNPARRLYERLGFRIIESRETHYVMKWYPCAAPNGEHTTETQ